MDLVEYFETKFTCSGVCEKSLFFFTLPMKEGPPTETCLTYMKEQIADNLTYMGMTVQLCSLVMLFTWCCQYCLWRKYD